MKKLKTILIADDEPHILLALQKIFEKEFEHIIACKTGEEAISEAITHMPDIIITDLMLPDQSGLDVCRILRANIKTAKIPIIMLTAKDSEVDIVVGLEVGADDYLSKPFSNAELIARVHTILRRSHTSDELIRDNIIHVGDLVLDMLKGEAQLLNDPLHLTRHEFDLIRVLAQSPYKTFSREELLYQVWGEDYVGDQRSVDVFIRYLRRKLEVHGAKYDYIVTVRGRGYHINDTAK